MSTLFSAGWFLAGFMVGFVGIAIFISNVSRLSEWASGGAVRREQEIRDATKEAERWKNRFTNLLEKRGGSGSE